MCSSKSLFLLSPLLSLTSRMFTSVFSLPLSVLHLPALPSPPSLFQVLIGTTFGSPLNYPPCPPTPYPTPPNLNTSSLDLYSESRYEAGQGERQVGGSMYEVVRGPGSRPASETEVLHVSLAVTAFRFIMKQSYICALIAMMVRS